MNIENLETKRFGTGSSLVSVYNLNIIDQSHLSMLWLL